MESKTMACKKCTEELGVYATSFQHGCYECWKLLQETIKAKDATIAELESRLEQSVDISVVNELNETIKAKDAEIERLLEQQAKDSYRERAGVFDNIIERKDKAIAEAREIIRTSLSFNGIKTQIEAEEKAKAWLESNK